MIDLDVLSAANVADPYPLFAHMRAHHPVFWSEDYNSWFLFRYDDVFAALRNPAFSSDRVMPVYRDHMSPEQQELRRPTFDILQHWLVFLDPPHHTRLRKLVMPAFSSHAMSELRSRVDAVVQETASSLKGRSQVDFVRDFAYPIPAVVIAEIMGAPREDRDRFKAWSDDILLLVFGSKTNQQRRARAQRSLVELSDYLGELAARRRVEPGDDLISVLVASNEAQPPLTNDELIATCALLIFGGHETTTNLIANGVRALIRNPDQLDMLVRDRSLIPSAVEELLRFDGPSKMISRRLVSEVEVRGAILPPGSSVHLVQLSANHDVDVFENPERLDLTRRHKPHVSFGFGLHHCLGSFLARLEGAAVLETLLDDLPSFRETGHEEWTPTLISRGMHSYLLNV